MDQDKLKDSSSVLPPGIVEAAAGDLDSPEYLAVLEKLKKDRGRQLPVDLLYTMTQIRFTPEEAETHWNEIVKARQELTEKLARRVCVRTAAMDYFTDRTNTFHFPKILDDQLFEQTTKWALTDGLTGLLNFRSFKERLQQEIDRTKRYSGAFTIIIYDIDDFKTYNDKHGHLSGDAVLVRLSEIFQESIREVDAAFRYGGEEFVLLLPETPKKNGRIIATRVLEAVRREEFRMTDGRKARVTLSGGLAEFPKDGHDEMTLIESADRALYLAKGTGKDRVCLYARERRNFTRIDATFVAEILPTKAPPHQKPEARNGVNLGLGGLLFESPTPIGINTHVKVALRHPGLAIRKEFTARVVRVEEVELGAYDIGLSFEDMSAEQQETIEAFVEAYAAI